MEQVDFFAQNLIRLVEIGPNLVWGEGVGLEFFDELKNVASAGILCNIMPSMADNSPIGSKLESICRFA
jgi:hypothetical protein